MLMTEPTHIGNKIPTFCAGVGSSDTHAAILSDGRVNRSPDAGLPYRLIDWLDICGMALEPVSVAKTAAPWCLAGNYVGPDGRQHSTQRQRGRFGMLAADVDAGNEAFADVLGITRAAIGEAELVIYSSRGATAENRKWRVLAPLAYPLDGDTWVRAQEEFFAALTVLGLVVDPVLARPGQLIFMPNRGDFYEADYFDGPFLDPLLHHVAEPETCVTKPWANNSTIATVARFNREHAITDLFERYGYTRQAGDSPNWRSPMQTSSSYGTRDFGGYWVSLSYSDRDAGIGGKHRNGYCWGDAFDLFSFFEHGNDMSAALRAHGARIRIRETATPPDVEAMRRFLRRSRK